MQREFRRVTGAACLGLVAALATAAPAGAAAVSCPQGWLTPARRRAHFQAASP